MDFDLQFDSWFLMLSWCLMWFWERRNCRLPFLAFSSERCQGLLKPYSFAKDFVCRNNVANVSMLRQQEQSVSISCAKFHRFQRPKVVVLQGFQQKWIEAENAAERSRAFTLLDWLPDNDNLNLPMVGETILVGCQQWPSTHVKCKPYSEDSEAGGLRNLLVVWIRITANPMTLEACEGMTHKFYHSKFKHLTAIVLVTRSVMNLSSDLPKWGLRHLQLA